jgi:hypothetical protein
VTRRAAALWLVPALALWPFRAGAAEPALAVHAVVRMDRAGGSATVIWTGPGKSYLLSCGHCFQGGARNQPVSLDVPDYRPARHPGLAPRVLAVDARRDLSLIEVDYGPMPYLCPVAPAGARPTRLVSVGYDDMRLPPTMRPCHIAADGGLFTFTRERPWHGRSGGGLIDLDSGYLFGVVSGYEGSRRTWTEDNGRDFGVYASHRSILEFLGGLGWSGAGAPGGYAPAPQRQPPGPGWQRQDMGRLPDGRVLQEYIRQPAGPTPRGWPYEAPIPVPRPQPQPWPPVRVVPDGQCPT